MTNETSNSNIESSSNNNIPGVVAQTSSSLTSYAEESIQNLGNGSGENVAVNNANEGGHSVHNPCSQISPTQIQPSVTIGWPPFGLPLGYTPPMGGYAPSVRFKNASGVVNNQPSFPHSDMSLDYHIGSTSNSARSFVVFRQHIDESHNDLVNLLTQQMIAILNPIMVDNEIKYERLPMQPRELNRSNCLRNKKKHLKMRKKFKNYKSLVRKEKVSYIEIESSKRATPPFVCASLEKVPNIDKVSETMYKGGKKYSFDISKSEQIFDVLLKDKQLVLPEEKTLHSIKDLKGKPFCKFHQATSHSTNNCVPFRNLIQEAIMEGRLKFEKGKKDMKVDVDPFDVVVNLLNLISWGEYGWFYFI
ncbi:hypothetical protein Ahy_A05g025081 [Arachis hypogaea]|uniref:Uncharacterized protein n=1 Tax=Arachis hypogaea TaxID=3818 RepID=A0A445D7U8_ARAHY|nr:hypothetical protein Ahy_A05g025081 [Arachis hypogaea]